jgi:hypothetical protein
MIYVLSTVLVSLRFGYGPSLLAAVLSVLCFDFFIPPLYTFAVHDLSQVVTFGVMLLVALVISGGWCEFHVELPVDGEPPAPSSKPARGNVSAVRARRTRIGA